VSGENEASWGPNGRVGRYDLDCLGQAKLVLFAIAKGRRGRWYLSQDCGSEGMAVSLV
jgi:hypothetical protein